MNFAQRRSIRINDPRILVATRLGRQAYIIRISCERTNKQCFSLGLSFRMFECPPQSKSFETYGAASSANRNSMLSFGCIASGVRFDEFPTLAWPVDFVFLFNNGGFAYPNKRIAKHAYLSQMTARLRVAELIQITSPRGPKYANLYLSLIHIPSANSRTHWVSDGTSCPGYPFL